MEENETSPIQSKPSMPNPPWLEMEEEEFNPKKSKPSISQPPHSPSWLDLPDPITELILENLPLPDYLRFASVCQKWLSIQKHHHHRHFPSQPPMSQSLPWIIPTNTYKDSPLHCFSPFNQSSYLLQSFCHPGGRCLFSCHGWILYDCDCHTFLLINPITTAAIKLPHLDHTNEFYYDGTGAMSAPPIDPDCTILLLDGDIAHLYRVNDDGYHGWTLLHLPYLDDDGDDSEYDESSPGYARFTTVFSNGRFYCISDSHSFCVVDPVLPKPLVQSFGMDISKGPIEERTNFLFEFDGEVLLAVLVDDPESEFFGVQVFRPLYSEKMWVRVDSLGDRALFIHHRCCFSLSAADVGCKKNCIYLPRALERTEVESSSVVLGDLFEAFDLKTQRWIAWQSHQDAVIKVDLAQFVYDEGVWFMPRLDSNLSRVLASIL